VKLSWNAEAKFSDSAAASQNAPWKSWNGELCYSPLPSPVPGETPDMKKRAFFYVVLLLVFGAGILGMLRWGTRLYPGAEAPGVVLPGNEDSRGAAESGEAAPHRTADDGPTGSNLQHPLSVLFLQLIVIIAVARWVGTLFRRLGQPAVIGEMIAGILLGPSFLGMLLPTAQSFLFPPASLAALKLFSEIGIILFMFLVGVDLDLGHLRRKADAAVLVSHASIVVPLSLGVALALFLYPQLAPPGVPFVGFALFTGTAMSITAFPVLARILAERSLTRTHLGSTALACAAVDDATAWCLLAVVVAIVRAGGWAGSLLTVVSTALFAATMLLLVRPWLARRVDSGGWSATGSKTLLAAVLTFVLASALLTEIIGIHALFGAFLAGVVMPARAEFRRFLQERLESFIAVFLLPLFFAFTGLRTQVALLGDVKGWLLCAIIIAAAIAGKLGGSSVAAKAAGFSWRESLGLGALMNARGLIELIALNIGYEMGVLSPRMFTMMVLMALITTCMTGPLLSALGIGGRSEDSALAGAHVLGGSERAPSRPLGRTERG
jgi:Kef-type K+ transport system membrane component KefB